MVRLLKIAFIFLHPFSESMGSVVRLKELTFSLSKLGIESYIFTPYESSFDISSKVHVVSFSDLFNKSGLSILFYKLTKFMYYTKSFPHFFSKTNGDASKLLQGIIKNLSVQIVRRNIDLIQVEQDVALPFGIALKQLTKLPLVVDLHNICSEELISTGIVDMDDEIYNSMQNSFKNKLKFADHVVVVSETMHQYVISNYAIRAENVTVVPPGGRLLCDELDFNKLKGKPKIVYAGLVAHREHVDLFVESMPFIIKSIQNVDFYITDKGDSLRKIKLLSREINVNPIFFWFRNYDALNYFLHSCTLGLIPSSCDLSRKMGTPAKLFTYLSAGLPVVANDIGGWTQMIKKNKVGELSSDDPYDFADTIVNLISNSKLMHEYMLNGLELIKSKYNWDNSAFILLEVYKKLLSVNN